MILNTQEHCFWGHRTITSSKNGTWHMFGVPANLTKTVFVYLYLCMYLYCVFACQRLGNIVFEVLVPFPFQKYSTCWVYL